MVETDETLPPPSPAVEVEAGTTMREIALCAGCGLPEGQWATPHIGWALDEGTFCCSSCADETGCICRNPLSDQTTTPVED